MSVLLSGAGIVQLPNPDLEDSEGRDISVDFKLAIDGTRTTYVKSSDRKKITYTWSNLGRRLIRDIHVFYRAAAGQKFNLTDFRGNSWVVIFAANPIDSTMNGVATVPGGHNEQGSITLEFLGDPN